MTHLFSKYSIVYTVKIIVYLGKQVVKHYVINEIWRNQLQINKILLFSWTRNIFFNVQLIIGWVEMDQFRLLIFA